MERRGSIQPARPEVDSQPRLEERILTSFGYEGLDEPIVGADGQPVSDAQGVITRRRFLDAYGASGHRTTTEDMIAGYLDMDPTDPDYADSREYIGAHLDAFLGASTDAN